MTDTEHQPLRLLIHAADEASLARARNNARNLLSAEPTAAVEIVVNGPAVAAALAVPDNTDTLLRLCANTLARQDLEAPAEIARVKAAVLYIAQRQRDGWAYMRA
ncbi:DsrE family protein [Salinisphaera sp. RV14]|uniref:DsrE family protein n=1 Tax=unclassified Salinisphaera TaxID=2649847 RepID=UPI003F84AE81